MEFTLLGGCSWGYYWVFHYGNNPCISWDIFWAPQLWCNIATASSRELRQ